MVIRVGAADLDVLIEDLLKEAVFVDYKKINAEDVTEEYVDITARLKSKKDALMQYELILKRANTIADILEVQQYIRTLQEEIESIEGRLKYLNNKVALSTINLTFYEQGKIMPMQSESFGFKVRQAISYGWQGLVTFFIAMIYLWPLWVIVIVALYLIRYFVKKARRKRAKKQQQ
jgi:Flp pilus assembly protein TadB